VPTSSSVMDWKNFRKAMLKNQGWQKVICDL
jgi:hypothetical protein